MLSFLREGQYSFALGFIAPKSTIPFYTIKNDSISTRPHCPRIIKESTPKGALVVSTSNGRRCARTCVAYQFQMNWANVHAFVSDCTSSSFLPRQEGGWEYFSPPEFNFSVQVQADCTRTPSLPWQEEPAKTWRCFPFVCRPPHHQPDHNALPTNLLIITMHNVKKLEG